MTFLINHGYTHTCKARTSFHSILQFFEGPAGRPAGPSPFPRFLEKKLGKELCGKLRFPSAPVRKVYGRGGPSRRPAVFCVFRCGLRKGNGARSHAGRGLAPAAPADGAGKGLLSGEPGDRQDGYARNRAYPSVCFFGPAGVSPPTRPCGPPTTPGRPGLSGRGWVCKC